MQNMAVFRGFHRVLNNVLFALSLCFFAISGNSAWAYSVSYVCEDPDGVLNQNTRPVTNQYNVNDSVETFDSNLVIQNCKGYNGYNFAQKWLCDGDLITAGNSFVMPNHDVTCKTQWDPIVYTIDYFSENKDVKLTNLSPTT